MKKLIPISAIVTSLLFSGCNIIKTIKILRKGEVAPTQFKEEITFESRSGLIVVPVIIDGKEYHFIFDSGAPNCVTKEVADELKLKPVSGSKSEDAEGKKGKVEFVMINELKLGKISFLNTAASIIDLKQVPELACLKIDGLIGANLMRKAYWQLDYVKHRLIFANSLDSLYVPADASVCSFKPLLSGTPVVRVETEDITSDMNIFDTGSSGGLTLSAPTFKKLKKKHPSINYIRGTGSNSAGLYGKGFDTSYMAKTNLKIGTLQLPGHIAEYKRDNGNLGSDFFKDYIISMDWSKNKIYFEPQPVQVSEWETFGFVALKNKDKLLVTFLFENSPATDAGMKPGDEIISISNHMYSPLTDEIYCEMIAGGLIPWKQEKQIDLVFKSSDGSEKKVTLQKRNLFTKN